MSKKRSKRIVSKRAADKRTTARRVQKVLAVSREGNATPCETAKSTAEIGRAHALADSLADWVAKSNTSPAESALDLRVRAFTMLVRSYTEARHGVCFLRRREGDANSIIPPLQGGRTRRAKRGAQTAEPSTAAVRPVA